MRRRSTHAHGGFSRKRLARGTRKRGTQGRGLNSGVGTADHPKKISGNQELGQERIWNDLSSAMKFFLENNIFSGWFIWAYFFWDVTPSYIIFERSWSWSGEKYSAFGFQVCFHWRLALSSNCQKIAPQVFRLGSGPGCYG